MKRTSSLTLLVLLTMLMFVQPAAAQSPTFRIDRWRTEPGTLRRGQEFDLFVTLTNAGTATADDVTVAIGGGGQFIGLDSGAFFTSISSGQQVTATLRGAVSNTITTGHYAIPLQISYLPSGGSTILSDAKTIGVFVAGLDPAGEPTGQPAFDVIDFSFDRDTLRRGEEFTLTLTFRNAGSWDGNSVMVDIGQGQQFVGLQASGVIDTIQIGQQVTVTLRGAVSNTITTGHYDLPLTFEYHPPGGQQLRATENDTIGVYVQGIAPSTGPDTGRPQLVIEDSQVVGSEESRIELQLTLHNVGNRWARGVIVNLGPSEYFSPAEGSSAVAVEGDIYVDQKVQVRLPLILQRAPEGRFTQDFTIEYASYSGGSFQTTERVPISLSGEVVQSPRLLIESYSAQPQPITPGAVVDLTLTLSNVGAGPARQVFVRLNDLGPLAPVDSSNVRFMEQLGAGQHTQLAYRLAVDGSATDGLVPINIELAYEDEFGVENTETELISLRVQAVPHFQIGLFEPVPQPVQVGEVFDLPIEVINIGTNRVNVSTVEVISDQLDISNGSIYLGPLDGGTSGTLLPSAEAIQPGEALVTVVINYLDNFQQPQTITETITIDVAGQSSPAGTNSNQAAAAEGDNSRSGDDTLTFGQRLWRAILGFFGLGTEDGEAGE